MKTTFDTLIFRAILEGENLHLIKIHMYKQLKEDNNQPWHEISNNVVCATSKGSDQPAHTRSLIRVFASRLNIL